MVPSALVLQHQKRSCANVAAAVPGAYSCFRISTGSMSLLKCNCEADYSWLALCAGLDWRRGYHPRFDVAAGCISTLLGEWLRRWHRAIAQLLGVADRGRRGCAPLHCVGVVLGLAESISAWFGRATKLWITSSSRNSGHAPGWRFTDRAAAGSTEALCWCRPYLLAADVLFYAASACAFL